MNKAEVSVCCKQFAHGCKFGPHFGAALATLPAHRQAIGMCLYVGRPIAPSRKRTPSDSQGPSKEQATQQRQD